MARALLQISSLVEFDRDCAQRTPARSPFRRRPVAPPAATVHTWPLRSLNSGAFFLRPSVRPSVRRRPRPRPRPPRCAAVYLLPIKHWATITTFTAVTAAARRRRGPRSRGRQWFHVELTIGGRIANFPGTSKTDEEEEEEGRATCISPKTSVQCLIPDSTVR